MNENIISYFNTAKMAQSLVKKMKHSSFLINVDKRIEDSGGYG